MYPSKAEWIANIKNKMPTSDIQDFEDKDRFVQWFNGHCFLWTYKNSEWDCEEL